MPIDARNRLESKDLILQLTNRSRLRITQALSRLLHRTDHGWRSAEQDLHVIRWLREPFL